MSEDDRAAKAARAKALLAKKRQQKKAAEGASGPAASPGSASPVIPSSTFYPVLRGGNPAARPDLADVFSQDAGDNSWVSSLPRAASPPAHVSSPLSESSTLALSNHGQTAAAPGPKWTELEEKIQQLESINATLQADIKRLQDLLTESKKAETLLEREISRADDLQNRYKQLEDEKERLLQAERQTIAFLVSEKASLNTELEKRVDFESKLQNVEQLLESERTKTEELEILLRSSQSEVENSSERIHQYQSKEKELTEKSRDLERQLQLATIAATESRKEAEQVDRRLQELTEQIQNDDRVERLENSLKHSQDHADELEFQLSKLKQTYTSLKSERDVLDLQCQEYAKHEDEWKAKGSGLDSKVSALQEKFDLAASERDSLAQEAATLRTQVEESHKSNEDLQGKLLQASSSVATHTRQIQVLQNELKGAIRRAEESEKTTRNLQLEGTNLMRSLDEMRPKIVELTDAKLDLAEKVEVLERALNNRDSAIAKLEASVDESQDRQEKSDKKWQESLAAKDKEHATARTNFTELQKAYSQLQEELDTALASLKTIESQRTIHHQEATRHLEEIDHLTSSAQAQSEELSNIRHELEARRNAQEEEQEFLERAQNEIESLRNELDAKDDEIERLRQVVSTPTRVDAPRSLDDEMLTSLRQQHALEISAAHSQIRALENTIFDGEARAHALQKQVKSLEDQMARLQAAARQPPRSFSPIPSRPSSRAKNHDLRRSSFGTHRPNPSAPPLSRSVFDQNLSPETLHKRKVSLSMLKARIDSEVASTASHPPSRTLSPVHSLSGKEDQHYTHPHPSSPSYQPHRPQFLDESHVFWCNSCQGDLVIL